MHLAETLVPKPIVYGAPQAALSIVCFGTTIMPVRQAMEWLRSQCLTG
jgi:hypothetical protein